MNTTMILTKEATRRGEYKATSLDAEKKSADILIQAVDDKYSIYVRGNIEIKGRGVEDYGNGIYAVTESKIESLKKSYKVVFDC